MPATTWDRLPAEGGDALQWSLSKSDTVHGIADRGTVGARIAEWQQQCEARLADALPSMPRVRRDPKKQRCWVHGRCLCRGLGLKIAHMRAAIQKELKLLFPRIMTAESDLDRTLLLDGKIVMKLRSRDEEQYLHVALQYLSPFGSTFLRLEQCLDNPYSSEQRLTLQAFQPSLSLLSEVEMLESFDAEVPLHMSLWQIVDSLEDCHGAPVPARVVVELLCEEHCVWHGKLQRPRRIALDEVEECGEDCVYAGLGHL
eukprot:2038419-Amphidinium_carterae.1